MNNTQTQFIQLFTQFLNQLRIVVPSEYKRMVYQLSIVLKVKDPNDTIKFFMNECKPYHTQILECDESYLRHLTEEFPFLNTYESFDSNSKECTLKYIQQLYLIALNNTLKNERVLQST